MSPRASALGAALALGLAMSFCAVAANGAEGDATCDAHRAHRGLVLNVPLGVGQSVICDLPEGEEAAEIYVSDPRIAEAVVRTARRIYVSALANGQTTYLCVLG